MWNSIVSVPDHCIFIYLTYIVFKAVLNFELCVCSQIRVTSAPFLYESGLLVILQSLDSIKNMFCAYFSQMNVDSCSNVFLKGYITAVFAATCVFNYIM